jgi:hypothetical protein
MNIMKYDLLVTRHGPLVTVLRERGIIDSDTPVVTHVEDPSILDGKHVVGVLPHHLSARCATITEVPMALTPEDRVALSAGDLSVDRTREIAGEPVTYVVLSAAAVADIATTIDMDGGWGDVLRRRLG